jgi:hypothetical protein
MSFRYKSALLSLISMALIYGWFFVTLMTDQHSSALAHVGRLAMTVVILAVVMAVGHILLVLTSREKYSAMDERERGFDRRATSVGYYLLIAGALAAISTLHMGASGPHMGYAVLLAIVVAECARQAVFLILHHRAA